MVAGAHPESDSATDAGTNRCPQGVPKMSQIRSVGSGNVLHIGYITATRRFSGYTLRGVAE